MRLEAQALVVQIILFETLTTCALDDWTEFKQEFNKTYNDPVDDVFRQVIFTSAKAEIDGFNSLNSERFGYMRGINEMSDWTTKELEELGGYQLSSSSNRSGKKFEKISGRILPKNFNWRQQFRVSSVKRQGKSNSSFAFAAVGLLEKLFASGRKDLSEQCVIDCIEGFPPTIQGALGWIMREGGIPPETEYPYYGRRDTCAMRVGSNSLSEKNFMIVEQSYDEEDLKNMIYQFGPIAVAMRIDLGFLTYKKGIFICNQNEDEDKFGYQAVLLVGFGTDARGFDFWSVKNSLGTSWGEAGFARIRRRRENTCGFKDITGILPNYPSSLRSQPRSTSTTRTPTTPSRPPRLPPKPIQGKKKRKGGILSKFYFNKPHN